MCGIAGYVTRADHGPHVLGQMTRRLAHRGPDGEDAWHARRGDWSVALGHRRLAIIDLAGGRQPMSTPSGALLITYNGETYNFRELRDRLVSHHPSPGASPARPTRFSGSEQPPLTPQPLPDPPPEPDANHFATRSDTEVVAAHYERHGPPGLADLNGMFAMALWDERAQTLTLARDRAGIKPLYYAPLPDGGVAFASELTAVLACPGVDARLDPDGIAAYFFADYIQPPRTILRGVRKLEPGHFLLWRDGVLSPPRAYWRLDAGAAPLDISAADAAAELRRRLDAAVAAQLVSDVPVGVFLSGGVDSSLVTALARRHAPEPPMTFSIRFADPQFDESAYARQVAAHVGTRHVEQTFTQEMLLAELDQTLAHLDEPMADPSFLPTYALSRLAASHVKVVLGGDGGDELWAGYPTYKAHRAAAAYRRLPRACRLAVAAAVSRLPTRHHYQALEWKAKRFALRWDDAPLRRHLRWMSNVDLPDLSAAVPGAAADPLADMLAGLTPHAANPGLNQLLALDFRTYLPGSVLAKVDRASMAHGLEVRPPLLDATLVDFAFSLPPRFKLARRAGKVLLKQVALDLLPPQIVHRPKRGFAIPLARWLTGPLAPRVRRVLDDSTLWHAGVLDRDTFVRWFTEHLNLVADRSKPLWALIVFDAWHRRVLAAGPIA